jgi:lysocardiolipin and lysophospholipid acyltransferase
MVSQSFRQRHPPASAPLPDIRPTAEKPTPLPDRKEHPAPKFKHVSWQQALNGFLFAVYFNGSILALVHSVTLCAFCILTGLSIAVTQFLGAPLYFYSKDYFYAWMAMSKQHFGIVTATMTNWWAPVKMRISGDESVRGQMRKTEDGRIELDFPERMVFVSNHQACTSPSEECDAF